MNLANRTKYFGILKSFDFENINKDTFPILIGKGIFNEFEMTENYSGTNYFGLETNISHSEAFNTWFLFNKKEYVLKEEIIIELLTQQVNSFEFNWLLSDFEEYIEKEISKEFIDAKKIDALENIYKQEYSFLKDKEFYHEYQQIKKQKDILKWFRYLEDELECGKYQIDYSIRYKFIANYLNGHNQHFIFPENLGEIWQECYLFDKAKSCLENHRNEILGIAENTLPEKKKNQKQIPDSKEIAIFKDNGLEIFNCIVYNSEKPKTPAFFSYLFHFLHKKNGLKSFGRTDNLKYREYTKERFKIKSFARIITSSSCEQTEQDRSFQEFEDILRFHYKTN